jgi:hypothetical protein
MHNENKIIGYETNYRITYLFIYIYIFDKYSIITKHFVLSTRYIIHKTIYRSFSAQSDINEPADKSKSNDIKQLYSTGS